MKPRRLHSDTIFSMSSWALGSAISGRGVFGKPQIMSRNWVKWNVAVRFRLRQVHPECAPLPEGRFDTDGGVHTLGRFLHNGQTNTGAGIIVGFVQAFEDAEDTVLVLRINADPIVFDA